MFYTDIILRQNSMYQKFFIKQLKLELEKMQPMYLQKKFQIKYYLGLN